MRDVELRGLSRDAALALARHALPRAPRLVATFERRRS
jgi:hypothetical protein